METRKLTENILKIESLTHNKNKAREMNIRQLGSTNAFFPLGKSPEPFDKDASYRPNNR